MADEILRNFLHIKSLQDLNYSKINEKNIFVKKEKDFDINLPKFLYKEIGKDYYWKDRLVWSDKNWSDYISQAGYQLHTLYKDKNLVGYYEVLSDNYLNFEIAYFGIFKEFFGRKMGGYLLSYAIYNSFYQGAKKVWVHTCTLDHPNALKNYLARGMKIFKTEKIFFNPENL
jgi:hypothetical protein